MSDLPSINGLPQIGGEDGNRRLLVNGVRRLCATIPSTIRYGDEDSANNYRINAARAALAYLQGCIAAAVCAGANVRSESVVESLAEIDALLRGEYDRRDEK